jgi:hypothetical protein
LGKRRPVSPAHGSFYGSAHLFRRYIQAREHAHGHAAFFGHQAQQDMFGPDEPVVEAAGFLSGLG